MKRKLYLIAYDISSPKRAAKALNIVKDYASHRQKSVFECWLNSKELLQLRNKLYQTLCDENDSLFITKLKKESAFYSLGVATAETLKPVLYIC
ncbi:MAG: CRISPR-associated endonuclease Cas2 [Venatoribacter sp.]